MSRDGEFIKPLMSLLDKPLRPDAHEMRLDDYIVILRSNGVSEEEIQQLKEMEEDQDE